MNFQPIGAGNLVRVNRIAAYLRFAALANFDLNTRARFEALHSAWALQQPEIGQIAPQLRRQLPHAGARGAKIARRVLGLQVAPALEGPAR